MANIMAEWAGADCWQGDVPEQTCTYEKSKRKIIMLAQVVLVGSDIPDLDASILTKAFDAIERHEASAAPESQKTIGQLQNLLM